MQKTMNQYVTEFSEQLRDALEIANRFDYQPSKEVSNVLICGLGGSGIGGTILAQLLSDHCPVPIQSSKDYTIPAFVNEHTLVIACSYSGNTEETLESLESAIQQKAQIACISSGGKLSELAIEHGWPLIKVPGGDPPRAAFAYALIQLLRMAEVFKLTNSDWQQQVQSAIDQLESSETDTKNAARQLAESIQHKTPVIYSSGWLEGVAIRWRQQLAENSKVLAWHHVYPEMNHNELVGWAGGGKELSVIFLLSSFDHPRVSRRMELTELVYQKKTPHIHHYRAQGESRIEQALHLIHLGDWISVFLADFRGADAIEIDVINWLKGELAKF